MTTQRVAVMGSGTFGTAFAKVLADAGNSVTMWARREDVALDIRERHRNTAYLPTTSLPPTVTADVDAAEVLASADGVVLAVPSYALRDNLLAWGRHIPADVTIVSLIKGLEVPTKARMSEVVTDELKVSEDRVVVISGPNHAVELAAEQPATTTVAGLYPERAAAVCAGVTTPYLQPQLSTDVVGCELGGAMKSVIALALGVVTGMGLGDNSKAIILSAGLTEMHLLGRCLGAEPTTFLGPAGMGDLIATCSSPLSCNRYFGEVLARSGSVKEAQAVLRQTAEGVRSSQALGELARAHGAHLPVTEHVELICRWGGKPDDIISTLLRSMARHL
ncbi:NAD(P)H-dependent glycerol-3-phosphate dehydrogenase [Streptomyces sp. NPDC087300]|uniref:NAD(P)H-dependent glycerol-3-phosphate dehydrogenase n=1 Tax=Streptomyces sp. NPDC087300 TaxID=3365780 RepID=UPI00381843CB